MTHDLPLVEFAYGFRYVELNHRPPDGMVSQADHNPWSIRQTALYQQYNGSQNKSIIIAIAPSHAMKESLERAIILATANNTTFNVFDLSRIITSTLQDNWRHYIRYLEQRLVEQVCEYSRRGRVCTKLSQSQTRCYLAKCQVRRIILYQFLEIRRLDFLIGSGSLIWRTRFLILLQFWSHFTARFLT